MIILPWKRLYLKKTPNTNREANSHSAARPAGETNLAEVAPGRQTIVLGFSPALRPEHKLQFQAYGLAPGAHIRVLQHSPVTVVQIDHLELALEAQLARSILIASDPGL